MKKILFALFLISALPLFSNSLWVLNDSPFKLTAVILTATGKNVGTMTISPEHQMQWQDDYFGTPTFSETPYTVIFYCPEGKEYGIGTNVSPGATVSAQASDGPKICKLPKKDLPPQTPQSGES